MRGEPTFFDAGTDAFQTPGDVRMQLDDLAGAFERTDPEDSWSAARRKHPEPAEGNLKRRQGNVRRHLLNQPSGASLGSLADEDKRQVQMLGTNEPQRGRPIRYARSQPTLFGFDCPPGLVDPLHRGE